MTAFRRLASTALLTAVTAGALALGAPAAQADSSCGELFQSFAAYKDNAREYNDAANYYHTRAQQTTGAESRGYELQASNNRALARTQNNAAHSTYVALTYAGCL